jgi:hypothetical protein
MCEPQEISVPGAAQFEFPLLSLEVDVGEAESASIAFGAFKIVDQAPGETSAYRNALCEDVVDRRQVTYQVAASLEVGDRASSLTKSS